MTNNLGTLDRFLRLLGGIALVVCGALAPLDPLLRVAALMLPGLYVLGTAAFGACLGYRLLGIASCAASSSRPIKGER
jgi:hypothetical protein